MTHSEGFFLFDSRFLWPFATPTKADWQQSDGLGESLLKTCSPLDNAAGHAAPRYRQDQFAGLRYFVVFIAR
jgi:hypothetical protein